MFNATGKVDSRLILFFLFSVLGTELRALHLLGKLSATELNPQPLIFFLMSLESGPPRFLVPNQAGLSPAYIALVP
jgi:hypothetical protein